MFQRIINLTLSLDGDIKQVSSFYFRHSDFNTTVLNVQLTSNGQPVDISGYIPYFECLNSDKSFIRDDGSKYQNLTVVDATQGQLTYSFADVVFAPSGQTSMAYFAFEKVNSIDSNKTDRITTNNFSFYITPDVSESDTVISDYISLLGQLNDAVNTFKQNGDLLTYLHDHAAEHLTGGSDPIPLATTTTDGLFNHDDKIKLNNLPSNVTYPVATVAGRNGDVILTKSDVGLSNVDNTSDLDKPVSILTQNAIDGRLLITTYNTDMGTVNSRLEALETAGEARNYTTITPNDTTVIPETNGIYVGVSGDLVVTRPDGTDVKWPNIAAGIIHPIHAIKIKLTNTTAANILAVYEQ